MKVAIFAAAALCLGGLCSCHSDKKDASAQGMPPEGVTVANPLRDSVVLHKTYPAYLAAANAVDVVARVNGYVTAKHFADGEWVRKGQPLFSIEPTTYQDQVNQSQAQLQTATANAEYAQRNYEAMLKAIESDAVSRLDVVQAQSNLQQAQASVKSAQSALTTARQSLDYCTIRAPFDGFASAPSIVVGNYVAGEGSPQVIMQVVDDTDLNVEFAIEDAVYLLIRDTPQGRAVDLTHVPLIFGDTIAGHYTARLTYMAPAIDRNTGTIALRLNVNNPGKELRSGMFTTVALPYATDPRAMLINDAAISTDQLGKYVYTVNDSDRVVYTPIQTGELYRDSMRLVTKGLSYDSRYVTRAMLKVRDGMKVNPLPQKQEKK